jgi:hypothetical protein
MAEGPHLGGAGAEEANAPPCAPGARRLTIASWIFLWLNEHWASSRFCHGSMAGCVAVMDGDMMIQISMVSGDPNTLKSP